MKFVLSFTSSDVLDFSESTFERIVNKKHKNNFWFVSYCLPDDDGERGDENCLDELVLRKLSIMLNGLVNVGTINCNYEKNLCSLLKPPSSNIFYRQLPKVMNKESMSQVEHIKIESNSYKEIAQKLLAHLPDVNLLNGANFEDIKKSLAEEGDGNSKPWLIQFVLNYQENSDLDLKKIPGLLNGKHLIILV